MDQEMSVDCLRSLEDKTQPQIKRHSSVHFRTIQVLILVATEVTVKKRQHVKGHQQMGNNKLYFLAKFKTGFATLECVYVCVCTISLEQEDIPIPF